jgi:phospholipid/cholesterol/gamma-HCH transport system substrate-binding protein
MKMRASNLLIGTATLAAIAIGLCGFLGYRKFHAVAQRGPLRIVFEGSASGLTKGGSVNFDGVHVGEVTSIQLDGPRKIVALVTLQNGAPIRKDTLVGLEAQGLTGLVAIALTGGAAAAPPVPLDADGIPTLTADLSEVQSIRDTLHNVDRVLVDNRDVMNNAVRGFETYTATLAANADAIDDALRKADTALGGFDRTIAGIDELVPGITGGKEGELYQKVKSIRELAQSFNKRSAAFIDEGRRSLLDISEGAAKVNQKVDPQGPPPRNRTRQ